MRVSEQKRNEIVKGIAARFRCFGKGTRPSNNPIAYALEDEPTQFAAGVNVKEVVDYVIKRLSEASKGVGV